MTSFKNKKIYKLMFMPGFNGIIWDIITETPVSGNSFLYILLNKHINFEGWRNRYAIKNRNFFEKDDASIFILKHTINLSMVHALLKMNDRLNDIVIYYWFDVDRTVHSDFKWTHCPLSKEPLVSLAGKYPKISSMVSIQSPLIFPSITM